MKRLLFIFFGIFSTAALNCSYAQQDIQFSQYMFERNLYNPAYLGILPKKVEVALNTRKQYLGLDGSPFTNNLTLHTPVGQSNVSIGARYISDIFQPVTNQQFYLSSAYRFQLKSINAEIALGGEIGVLLRFIDYSSIRVTQKDDQSFQGESKYYGNNVMPDLGLGAYFRKGDWYAGIAAKHLIPSRIGNLDFERNNPARLYRTYFAMGGGSIKLGQKISTQPSFLFKASESFVYQADLSLLFSYTDFLSLGCSYRTNNTLIPVLSVQVLKGFYLSYSYDRTFGDINNVYAPAWGSHEFLIRYTASTVPIKQRIVDPRYSY